MKDKKDAFSLFAEDSPLPLKDLSFSAFCSLLESCFFQIAYLKQEILSGSKNSELNPLLEKKLDLSGKEEESAVYDSGILSVSDGKRLYEIFRLIEYHTRGNLSGKEEMLLEHLIKKYTIG